MTPAQTTRGRRLGGGHVLAAMLALVVALAGACGSEPIDPVDRAERSLRDLQSGDISLELTATPDGGEPVGFVVEGPFSVRGDAGDLVVARLRYRQLLGAETIESTLISTGERAWLQTSEGTTSLSADQADALRLAEDGKTKPAGLGSLDLSEWVIDPQTDDGPRIDGEDTRRVRGRLDASSFIADLAAIAAGTAGIEAGADARTSASSDGQKDGQRALQRLVETSSVEILLAKADDAVRRIEAQVRFTGDVPAEVRKALGPYAAVDLRLELRIDEPNKPVKVKAPPRA